MSAPVERASGTPSCATGALTHWTSIFATGCSGDAPPHPAVSRGAIRKLFYELVDQSGYRGWDGDVNGQPESTSHKPLHADGPSPAASSLTASAVLTRPILFSPCTRKPEPFSSLAVRFESSIPESTGSPLAAVNRLALCQVRTPSDCQSSSTCCSKSCMDPVLVITRSAC